MDYSNFFTHEELNPDKIKTEIYKLFGFNGKQLKFKNSNQFAGHIASFFSPNTLFVVRDDPNWANCNTPDDIYDSWLLLDIVGWLNIINELWIENNCCVVIGGFKGINDQHMVSQYETKYSCKMLFNEDYKIYECTMINKNIYEWSKKIQNNNTNNTNNMDYIENNNINNNINNNDINNNNHNNNENNIYVTPNGGDTSWNGNSNTIEFDETNDDTDVRILNIDLQKIKEAATQAASQHKRRVSTLQAIKEEVTRVLMDDRNNNNNDSDNISISDDIDEISKKFMREIKPNERSGKFITVNDATEIGSIINNVIHKNQQKISDIYRIDDKDSIVFDESDARKITKEIVNDVQKTTNNFKTIKNDILDSKEMSQYTFNKIDKQNELNYLLNQKIILQEKVNKCIKTINELKNEIIYISESKQKLAINTNKSLNEMRSLILKYQNIFKNKIKKR